MTNGIDMTMISDRDGQTDKGRFVPAGTTVEYVCHVGWPIRVRFDDGTEDVMNAHCFPTMRSDPQPPKCRKCRDLGFIPHGNPSQVPESVERCDCKAGHSIKAD